MTDLEPPLDDPELERYEPEPHDRPVVRLTDHGRASDAADAALEALASTRRLLRRGGGVVSVRGWVPSTAPARTAPGSDDIERPVVAIRAGSPTIHGVGGGALDYAVDQAITFETLRRPPGRPQKGEPRSDPVVVTVPCPGRILGMIGAEGGYRTLPPCEGILETPSLRPDGTVIDRPGYDPATGYFLASDLRLVRLAPSPTIENARRALVALQDLFAPTDGAWGEDSPFAGLPIYGFPWRRGMAETIVPIALCLSLLARPAIGNVPAFVVDASTPGSGKGKVIGICSIIATGEEPARAGWPSNPEEQDKTIGSYAAAGPPLIAWDNVRGSISNSTLENALTTPMYGFRVLGASKVITIPFRSVVTFTVNNGSLGGDMSRRVLVSRLEPGTEHPDRIPSGQFRHPYIELLARQQRAKYIAACLTILRAYYLAGMPDQGLQMGSFDKSSGGLGWIELIGGALKWCGAGDITEFSGKDNIEEPEEWGHVRALLASWHRLDPSGHGLELSEVRSLLYPEDVVEILRKGGLPPPSFGDWHAERAAIQSLARTPDRMVPDTTKLGNHMRPYINRWFRVGDRDRSFARAISPATGKSYVPARWKVEER